MQVFDGGGMVMVVLVVVYVMVVAALNPQAYLHAGPLRSLLGDWSVDKTFADQGNSPRGDRDHGVS